MVEIRTPIGLANAEGLVWVASADGNEIRGINPQNGLIGKSIDVGKTPLRPAAQSHVVSEGRRRRRWGRVSTHGDSLPRASIRRGTTT